MYSMWNANFLDIYKSIKRKQDGLPTNLEPFYFTIDQEGPKCKFKIEELDSLTSRYKDEESFREELSKYDYLNSYSATPIIITHTASGKIYEDSIIYNDRLITKIATELRMKKKKKKIKKEKAPIIINSSKELLDFIEYVKSLAFHPISSKYLLRPDTLSSKIIGEEDKYLLKNIIKDDIELKLNNNTQKRIRGLRSILGEYVGYSQLLKTQKSNNESTIETEQNLNEVNQELLNYFKKDYKNIRNIIIWEELYKKNLEKQIKNTEDMNKKQQLTNCIEYVNLQKRYRNERLDPMEWEYYQESYKENEMEIIKPTKSKLTVQNKEMLSLFEQGGIEAIMEQMDANEIYKNQEDAEALGIIKPTKR